MSVLEKTPLHVVVAVLVNHCGEICIAKRPPGKPLAGYWEFPGGKLEPGEAPREALARELREELGIELLATHPLIRFYYDYPERRVFLDTWRVNDYGGKPRALEGQVLEWVNSEALSQRQLLPASGPIVKALRLPTTLLVTPEPGADEQSYLKRLDESLDNGVRLVQLRAHGLKDARFTALAARVIDHCHRHAARCIVNASPERALAVPGDGLHLNAARLMRCERRPLDEAHWVGASCHNAAEIDRASRLALDYIVVGPILPTASHPEQAGLGWSAFNRLIEDCNIPAYAIGGMRHAHLRQAQSFGAQGIAAIRSLWGARAYETTHCKV